MKKLRKTLSLLLCPLMISSQLAALTVVDASAAEGVTGATQVITESIYINGEDTGVQHTQMLLPQGSKYAPSSDGVVNIAELIPGSDATFKVINHGDYNWGKSTVGDAAVAYNQANKNSTVLAAINACPWLMATTDYDGDHVTATGPSVKGGAGSSMAMGFMMIDGEIWNTDWFTDENKMDNKYYKDWVIADQDCFYVCDDGTYAIGHSPKLTLDVQNKTSGKTVEADAINRLPAPDSTILYNKRVYSESLAYEDAYEIYLDCKNSSFMINGTVKGTVTAIFESGDTADRPDIGENTVVISARGKAINKLAAGNFSVGDEISIVCFTQEELAQSATQIIGGFFTLMENGTATGQPTNPDLYPCSIVGIRKDGSAILVSITSQLDKKYHGSRMMDIPSLLKELNCVDALLFDGGGSTTFVTLEEGAYIRRNGCSDGQLRTLGNSLAIVYDYEGDDVDVDGSFDNSSLIGLLDGEQNDNRPEGYIAPPEVFDENAAVLGYAKTNIPYCSCVDWINGLGPNGDPIIPYTTLSSLLNVASGEITAATADGTNLTTDDNYQLSVSGWAQTATGQGKYYWSVDGYSWYECVGGTYEDATAEITAAAQGSAAAIAEPSAANARFGKIAADLTAYEGQTVDVHFAVAESEGKLVNILTVDELTVAHKHVYDHACDTDCNRCGEARTTEGHAYDHDCDGDCNVCGSTREIGDHVDENGDFKCDNCDAAVAGEVVTTTPTEPVTEEVTTEEPSEGCNSVIGLSSLSLTIMLAAWVCMKKKED